MCVHDPSWRTRTADPRPDLPEGSHLRGRLSRDPRWKSESPHDRYFPERHRHGDVRSLVLSAGGKGVRAPGTGPRHNLQSPWVRPVMGSRGNVVEEYPFRPTLSFPHTTHRRHPAGPHTSGHVRRPWLERLTYGRTHREGPTAVEAEGPLRHDAEDGTVERHATTATRRSGTIDVTTLRTRRDFRPDTLYTRPTRGTSSDVPLLGSM